MICKTCHQEIKGGIDPRRLPDMVNLSDMQTEIFNNIMRHTVYGITVDKLVELIYIGRLQPETAEAVIHVQIGRIKTKISDYGWGISYGKRKRLIKIRNG